MTENPRFALITAFTGKTKDRFHEYNVDLDLAEKMELVSRIEGMSGVEVVYPHEIREPARLNALLARFGLAVAAVNVNIKAEPGFRNGSLSSGSASVRRRAVRLIREAKDFAAAVGADKVTCCPLADGYEFAFQCDYARAWKRLVETLGEAASYKPSVPLFIEYKPSETRGRCFVDTAAKTLSLLNDIGVPQMGVTLDYGHSKYGLENPAEVVSRLADSLYPYYVHINDNNGRWDWDFMVASDNFLAYVEFLFYLQERRYEDYLTSDTSPTRWDIVGMFEANVRMTRRIWERLRSLDRQRFRKLIRSGDFLETWKFIEKHIFRLE